MKLSEYAKKNSMHYRTAWVHFKNGLISGARQLPTGTIVVDEEEAFQPPEYNVIYTRVSSSENKPNLDAQAERLQQFCAAKGWIVHEVVKECASGLNDKRPRLSKIFSDRKATRLIVEHKDRLTRFGANYINLLWPECEIIIVNEMEDKDSLMEDFVSLVTSFCARIYGHRRSKRKTEQIIRAMKEDEVGDGDVNHDTSRTP